MKLTWRRIYPVLEVLLGNLIFACGVHFFLTPSGIITGGATGISLFLHARYGITMSTFLLIFNVVMLIIAYFTLGRSFAINTIISTFAYPVFIGIFERVCPDVVLTQDLLLNAVFTGLGIGVGLGLVFRAGASTGGMDIPPWLLQKYCHIPVSVGMWGFDIAVILLQAMFSETDLLLYGIVALFLYTIIIDKLTTLGTSKTEVKVISEKSQQICDAILSEADRGVTFLKGRSGYLGKETELVLTVVEPRELPRVERIIHIIDPGCFMVVTRISAVSGRGFTADKKHLKQEKGQ